jgi:uncharacterized protein (DUF486 family)
MRILTTIALLTVSNVFMTFAWYGHLKLKQMEFLKNSGLITIILISWGIALFEYVFLVPANRMGSQEMGGPFNIFQLRIIQEVISLIVFTVIVTVMFKNESFKWNHMAALACLVLAVYFVFQE